MIPLEGELQPGRTVREVAEVGRATVWCQVVIVVETASTDTRHFQDQMVARPRLRQTSLSIQRPGQGSSRQTETKGGKIPMSSVGWMGGVDHLTRNWGLFCPNESGWSIYIYISHFPPHPVLVAGLCSSLPPSFSVFAHYPQIFSSSTENTRAHNL